MPDTPENPFLDTLITRQRAEPCTMVIFGATGDLTNRKLIPALYNLAASSDLPTQFKVVGFARREKSDLEFRTELEEGNKKFSRQGHSPELWASFAQSIHYHRSEFTDAAGYAELKNVLDKFDAERGAPANRLFYLATAPEFFPVVLEQLAAAGLNEPPAGKWARVVCEKPFGTDLASAQKLNKIVSEVWRRFSPFGFDNGFITL